MCARQRGAGPEGRSRRGKRAHLFDIDYVWANRKEDRRFVASSMAGAATELLTQPAGVSVRSLVGCARRNAALLFGDEARVLDAGDMLRLEVRVAADQRPIALSGRLPQEACQIGFELICLDRCCPSE